MQAVQKHPIVILACLGLLASIVCIYTTSTGIGLSPDSFYYIASARSLTEGKGVSVPLGLGEYEYTGHFPPLYPGLLALSSLSGYDPVETARWLGAFLFGANVFLAGYIIYKLTKGALLVACLGALVILSAGSLILIHSYAWSEPPFFFLLLIGLHLLSSFLEDHRMGFLVGAGVATALAFLTRYVGIVLVMTGVFSLILLPKASLTQKIKYLVVYLLTSSVPIGLWMVYNQYAAGSLADRSIAYHPVNIIDLKRLLKTIAEWLTYTEKAGVLQYILMAVVIVSGLCVLVGSAVLFFRWRRLNREMDLPRVSVWPYVFFTFLYPAFLLVSLSFLDAQTGLDTRILSPVFITGVILLATFLASQYADAPAVLRGLAWVFCVSLICAYLISGVKVVQSLHAGENKGYASKDWANSKLLEQIRGLPEGIPIYSNGQDVIYLLTGRPARGIPKMYSPNTMRANERFEEGMQSMQNVLKEKKGVLVIFYELQEQRRYLPAEFDLNELLPLKRVTKWSKEGSLYRIEQ